MCHPRRADLWQQIGLSLAEIADIRNTKQGTIKTQCNAIYQKAGVTGRPQLLSLFIE
ncbi:MAG: hypothetical protein HKN05_23270 [Rhizobiales bacterium]|nr:hypothetical protein [Hyphomicrobiales bacterium]